MGLLITPESEWGKELAKWNVQRPHAEFPMCLIKAQRRPDGKWSTGEVDDRIFGEVPGAAEGFTRTCQHVFQEEQFDRAIADGWRKSAVDALDWREKEEKRKGDVAANRAHQERSMSDQAKATAAQAEAASPDHTLTIPEAPRRRGRPRKVAAPGGGATA